MWENQTQLSTTKKLPLLSSLVSTSTKNFLFPKFPLKISPLKSTEFSIVFRVLNSEPQFGNPITNMDHRLRYRGEKKVFSGFTTAEMEKMERVLKETGQLPDSEVIKKLTTGFNRSAGRAGKPVLKWTEVQDWLLGKHQDLMSKGTSFIQEENINETSDLSKGEKVQDLSNMEFEAKSSDYSWYDVETFITHRFLESGEPQVLVRYVGFGTEEDEWVHAKNVRERSVPLEHSECNKVMVGDTLLCFQEKKDQARYYDAQVIDIERKLHDIRGCRCVFRLRYEHDNSEESVRLDRLCGQPEY